jgi:hypothetical protein
MPSFENDEQVIAHYKKVILPLEVLVQIANKSSPNSKIDITINVKGLTISGSLVALKEYFTHTKNIILESVRQNQNNDPETFESMKDILDKTEAVFTSSGEKVNEALVNSYVCIKDPRYQYRVNEYMQILDLFWIGKLESVDGFMIGSPPEDTV